MARPVGTVRRRQILAACRLNGSHVGSEDEQHLVPAAEEHLAPFRVEYTVEARHILIEPPHRSHILRIQNGFEYAGGFHATSLFWWSTSWPMPRRASAKRSRNRASLNGSPSAVP